jgi:hypothetical protein
MAAVQGAARTLGSKRQAVQVKAGGSTSLRFEFGWKSQDGLERRVKLPTAL